MHNKMLTDTENYLRKITEYLGVKPTDDTANVLSQERWLRVIQNEEYLFKVSAIQDQASPKAFSLLMEMDDQFKISDTAI